MSLPRRSRTARMTTGGRAPRKMLKDSSPPHNTAIYVSSDEDDSNWHRCKKRRNTVQASDETGTGEREMNCAKHELAQQFELLEHGIQGIRQRTTQLESHLICGICDEIFASPHL
ncbi:hypothetical protein V5O48_010898 [Marasmius crinis-equi]|uniref:Uncharacterized protein n=1 Tax=Marasmius crinis-equi TaxID=585013 RepID=A0ABR3F722_9AGAR